MMEVEAKLINCTVQVAEHLSKHYQMSPLQGITQFYLPLNGRWIRYRQISTVGGSLEYFRTEKTATDDPYQTIEIEQLISYANWQEACIALSDLHLQPIYKLRQNWSSANGTWSLDSFVGDLDDQILEIETRDLFLLRVELSALQGMFPQLKDVTTDPQYRNLNIWKKYNGI